MITSKKCSSCNETKDIECFQVRSDKPHLRRGQCAECRRLLVRKYKKDNAENIRKKRRLHYLKNREYTCRKTSEYKKQDPEKWRKYINKKARELRVTDVKTKIRTKAVNTLTYAKTKGEVAPEPCVYCGNKKSEAHHNDYTKPLEVQWMCRKHHQAWHRLFIPEYGPELKSQGRA